ncbi:MAG: hypothetical protein IJS99_10150 [Synergistaceae bacterium]|nr:hypothetical protein [Synergistaceae bacterium]
MSESRPQNSPPALVLFVIHVFSNAARLLVPQNFSQEFFFMPHTYINLVIHVFSNAASLLMPQNFSL